MGNTVRTSSSSLIGMDWASTRQGRLRDHKPMPPARTGTGDSSGFNSAECEEFTVRLAGLLAPHADEEIPTDPFPPGVDEPHRADEPEPFSLRPNDSEEPERVSDYDGTDVALEVNFKDGSLSALKPAGKWTGEWLGKPNPALDGLGPDDVLANGDEAHRDYLFGLIVGIECGVHSRRQALFPAFGSERCRLGIGATHWASPTHSHCHDVTTSPQAIGQQVSGAGSCIARNEPA